MTDDRSPSDATEAPLPDPAPGAGADSDPEVVPRLPRSPDLFKLALPDLIRIGLLLAMLVAVIVMRRSCGEGAATLLEMFDEAPDAGAPALQYERLTPDEIERRFAPDAAGADETGSPRSEP